MKRFEVFCPKCGHGLGRHRVATEAGGASDFECSKCGLNFSLTDKENNKNLGLLFISAEKPEDSFCPMCGPERSIKYAIINSAFICTNQKCKRTVTVSYWI